MKKIVYFIQHYGRRIETVDHHGDVFECCPQISSGQVTKEFYEKSEGREDIVDNYYYKRIYDK